MILYRLGKCAYAGDLSGTGARLYGGRWNSIGKAAVYMASSRALAVLEVLVHIPPGLLPADYCIATVEVPEDNVLSLAVDQLPDGWNEYPEPVQLKQLGDQFLDEGKYLLLKVPSAIVNEEFNFILNPQHPLVNRVKLLKKNTFAFDNRLL